MDKISNKLFYKKAIQEFGVSAQGVHWNSKYTQYKRFEIITKFIKNKITSSSIADVGCGFGEYYNYLTKNNKKPLRYTGIDCESYMIEVSKKRFNYVEFLHLNILSDPLIKADYFIASGTLNLLRYDEVNTFITKCFNNSQKGFIFNFLKDITFTDVTQQDILDICNKLTANIKLQDNYLENDFTVFLSKQ
jgi:SAM-dependent methyltransferase